MPVSSVAEGVVVSAGPALTLVRITSARDAVTSGDLVVPRKIASRRVRSVALTRGRR